MLSSRLLLSSSLAVLALSACDSQSTSAFDGALLAKVEVVTKCFPPQMEKLKEILELSKMWRQTGTNDPDDPQQLVWSEDGTTITYSISLPTIASPTFTISGIIRFYDPTGGPVTGLPLSSVSLSQAIDNAATELRDRTPGSSSRPYIVAEWTITGANVSSIGGTSSPASLTGHIAGSANDNELEEIQTTQGTAQAMTGPPQIQDAVVTTTGTDTCVFTFRIDSLKTDEFPTQEYPIGTIVWSLALTGGQTVAGTLVFDSTVIAVLNVTDVGTFSINIETSAVTSL